MTISATYTPAQASGNGVTVAFPFVFKTFDQADLVVIITDTDDVDTTQTITTHYTVALNADQNNNPGGTVTMLTAPASGETLTIARVIDALQETDIANGGGFYPEVLEDAFDRLTMLSQQNSDAIDRSFSLPVTVAGVNTELPVPAANAIVGWNATADALQNYDLSVFATVVSFGTAKADIFDGDGVTTDFTLTANPGAQNNLDVSISGITQTPGIDYTWTAGTTISFAVAPPSGTDNVLVRYMQGLANTNAQDAAYTPAGATAVETTIKSKLRETISVEDFGAVTQTDSTAAIRLAVAACLARAKPTRLTFPNPPYYITDEIVIDPTSVSGASILLDGGTAGISTLKCVTGFTAARAIYFGPPAASTTRHTGNGIINFSVDGNSLPAAGGVAGIYIWNSYRGQYRNIIVDNFGAAGVGDGITSRGHASGVAADPCNQFNVFHNIITRNNGQDGQYYRGEKGSMFDMLVADNNADQGIFWDSETITAGSVETTENNIGMATAKNNGGAGFAFSGIAKFSVGTLQAYINGGAGVRIRASRSGTTAPCVYSSIGNLVSRNNAGAVVTDVGNNAVYCQGVDIGSVVHVGGKGLGGTETEAEAFKIAGWSSCTVGRFNSQLNIGTCLRILNQTGARVPQAIAFGEVMLVSNGSANATTNHGVSIEDTANLITFNKLHSANAYTTAAKSSYELVTAVGASAVIGNLYAYAADAGREVSIGNQSLVDLPGESNIRGLIAERKVSGRSAAAAITAYGSYSNEFWDNSSAVRKYARMGDSTLRLLSGEKGTFTPALTFATPGDQVITYGSQVGRYELRGSKCFVEILVSTATFTHTTAAGGLRITGLPFAAGASSNDGAPLTGFGGITKANFTQYCVLTQNSQTYLVVYASGSGQALTAVGVADVPTGGTVFLKVAFDYEVDLPLA